MVESSSDIWHKIMELALHYPSPHNGQPIKLEVNDENSANIYFDTARGLFASDLGFKFAYLSVGVFLEYFIQSAEAVGIKIEYFPDLTKIDINKPPYLHYFGKVKIVSNQKSKPELQELLLKRQTSRGAYFNEPIKPGLTDKLEKIAKSYGYEFHFTHDEPTVREVMWLNQTRLFKDLKIDPLRQELDHWLRYNRQQAKTMRDGLSALCLHIPGFVLHLSIKYPNLVNNPKTNIFFKKVYLRTMKHVPLIAWLQGPFENYQDYISAGRCFLQVWLGLSEEDYYIHPYGTIPTNPETLSEFANIVGAKQTQSKPIWMIFRFGKSGIPPRSYRLELEDHFVKVGGHD